MTVTTDDGQDRQSSGNPGGPSEGDGLFRQGRTVAAVPATAGDGPGAGMVEFWGHEADDPRLFRRDEPAVEACNLTGLAIPARAFCVVAPGQGRWDWAILMADQSGAP